MARYAAVDGALVAKGNGGLASARSEPRLLRDGFFDRGAALLPRGDVDLARCVGVDCRYGEADHEVRPGRASRRLRSPPQ